MKGSDFCFKNLFIITITLVIFSLLVTSCSTKYSGRKSPDAHLGVMDLTNWEFKNDGLVQLNGEWEFYWERLLTPEDFRKEIPPVKTGYFKFPGYWKNYQIKNNKIKSHGYASFRLVINTSGSDSLYSLKIGRVFTAYKLWVNNHLLASQGQVGRSENEMVPAWIPLEIFFPEKSETLELVLQISNFKHNRGGISGRIFLGLPGQISNLGKKRIGLDFFLFGILLMMSLYLFGLFFLRKNDPAPLYFGLVFIFTIITIVVNREVIITGLIKNPNWEICSKMDYVANYLRASFFVLYIGYLFKEEILRVFVKGILIWGVVMSILVLFTPAKIYSHTNFSFEMIALAGFLYLTYGLVRALLSRKEGALFSLLGTLALLFASSNDILYDNLIIQTVWLFPVGLFLFVFFHSFMLSIRFSNLLESVKKLSNRLLKLDKIKNQFLSSSFYKLTKPLSIVAENVEADRGFILRKKYNKWNIIAAYGSDIDSKVFQTPVPISQSGSNSDLSYISGSIVNYVQRTDEVFLYDPFIKEPLIHDPRLDVDGKSSLICMPLHHHGKIKGVLYLESSSVPNNFDEEKIKILDLLTSQLAVLVDNAEIYQKLQELNRNLEERVKDRTAEIERQKEEVVTTNEELQSTLDNLKRTQSQLIESEKMASLGGLVAGVAHEINTPVGIGVTAVSSLIEETKRMAELYKKEEITRADFKEYLTSSNNSAKLIQKNLERTASLVQSFKQVSVDQSTEQQREFNLKSYLEDVIRSLYPKFKRRNIDVNIDCDEELQLNSYPGAFAQIFTNLVLNSITHGFKKENVKGVIDILVKQEHKELQIEYKDNGMGISQEILPKIFDPFFTTDQSKGTGLGLNIVYNLVTQKLKGSINCESQPGQSVLFILKLPKTLLEN
ncbi:MAG: GAF domain-containing protein [Bacteroidales bacterium]|nr:GAF domain-containing protein [Bacteroidales bacterium]